jgi:hypothetical protein
MMTMVYVGLAMLLIGWFMISFFGVSADDFEKGKPYEASDTVASFLMVIGAIVTAAFGSIALVRYLWKETSSLFYGADSAYAQMSLWTQCQTACGLAATLFFLSMMVSFHTEAQFRKTRRFNHAKARVIRARWVWYAGLLYSGGMLVLAATVGLLIAKSL